MATPNTGFTYEGLSQSLQQYASAGCSVEHFLTTLIQAPGMQQIAHAALQFGTLAISAAVDGYKANSETEKMYLQSTKDSLRCARDEIQALKSEIATLKQQLSSQGKPAPPPVVRHAKECRQGKECARRDCRFDHPAGRVIEAVKQ